MAVTSVGVGNAGKRCALPSASPRCRFRCGWLWRLLQNSLKLPWLEEGGTVSRQETHKAVQKEKGVQQKEVQQKEVQQKEVQQKGPRGVLKHSLSSLLLPVIVHDLFVLGISRIFQMANCKLNFGSDNLKILGIPVPTARIEFCRTIK